jgi:hypothetical protein
VPGQASGAHRLVLTAAEIALLVGKCSIDLPPGFATGEVDASALRQAASALATRGVVVESDDLLDCRPVPSIAVNLAVLASPVVTVRVEVSVDGRGLRAFYAVSGPLGASLFGLADGAVELSMFPAETLGLELIRAVPRPDELVTACSVTSHRPRTTTRWTPRCATPSSTRGRSSPVPVCPTAPTAPPGPPRPGPHHNSR